MFTHGYGRMNTQTKTNTVKKYQDVPSLALDQSAILSFTEIQINSSAVFCFHLMHVDRSKYCLPVGYSIFFKKHYYF